MEMINRKRVGSKTSLQLMLALSLATVMFLANSNKTYAQTGDDEVYIAVEEMPTFPGGDKALHESLYRNLRYPEEAYNNNIEGKVLIRFVITKEGAVTNVTVLRSADVNLDKAALDAVKKLPKFNPGKQGGKPVAVWFTLPIVFKMQ
jgi:periplasmic protein TonB